MKKPDKTRIKKYIKRGLLVLLAVFFLPIPVKRAVDVELDEAYTDVVFADLAGERVTLLCVGNVRVTPQSTMTMEEIREDFRLRMTDSCNGYDVLAIQNEYGILEPLHEANDWTGKRRDGAGKRVRVDIAPADFVGSALQSYQMWYPPARNRFAVAGTLEASGRHGYTLHLDSWDIAYPIHHSCLAEETEYYQRYVFLFDYLRTRFFWLWIDETPF